MADDVILVKYQADLKAFEASLNEREKQLRSLEATGKKSFKGIEDAGKDVGNKLSSTFASIGAGIVAAFSVNAIMNFAKASVDAFARAEAQTNQLRFAVEKVGKMGTKVFDDLIKQSKELAKISFFDDEDIQDAQRLLVQIGLNADEIKKLTPLVLDLAAAQGTDLASAAEKAVQAINGQTRGLKDVGANFENTGTKVGNYNLLVERLGKIQGSANDALNTASGALKQQAVEVENLQEKIGERLFPFLQKLKIAALQSAEAVSKLFFPDSAKDQARNELDIVKAQLETKFAQSTIETLRQEVIDVNKQIEETKQKARDIKAGPFSLSKGERIQEQVDQVAFLEKSQLALREIVLDRLNAQRADQLNANNLAKQDAEKLAADQAEIERKKHEKFWEQLKQDVANYEASQNEILAAMSKSIDDQIAEDEKLEKHKRDILSKTVDDEADARKQIEKLADEAVEKNKKRDDEELKRKQALLQLQLQFAVDVVSTLQQLENQSFQTKIDEVNERNQIISDGFDKEAEALEKRNERGAISDREYARQKETLDKKRETSELAFAKLQRKIAHDQAVANKIFAIFEIILRTAQAVATANTVVPPGNIPAMAFAAAAGALQLIVASAQPIPALAKGTKFVRRNGRPVGTDTIPAWLDEGERVIDKHKNKKNWEIYEALDNNKFHEFVTRKYVVPIIIDFQKKQAEKIRSDHANRIGESVFQNMNGLTSDEMKKLWKKGISINNLPQDTSDPFVYNKYGSW